MPEAIAQIVALGRSSMTPQMLVDLALKADQDKRAAMRAGNLDRAVQLEEECNALLELAKEA